MQVAHGSKPSLCSSSSKVPSKKIVSSLLENVPPGMQGTNGVRLAPYCSPAAAIRKFVRRMEVGRLFKSILSSPTKTLSRERIDEGRFAHYGSLEDATSVEMERIVSLLNSRIFATAADP